MNSGLPASGLRLARPSTWTRRFKASWKAARAAWVSYPPDERGDQRNDLTEVLESSSDAVLQFDAQGRLLYSNPSARIHFGIEAESPVGSGSVMALATFASVRKWHRSILPTLRGASVWVGELELRVRGPGRVTFSTMVIAHRGADAGVVQRFSAVLRDASADAHARQLVQRQNSILSAIAEALPATVVIVDSTGNYRFVNSAFERMVGMPAERIIGRSAIDVLGPEEVARRRPFMQRAMSGESVEFILDYPGSQGTVWRSMHCIPLNLDGSFDGFLGISQDVTEQQREHQRLAELAARDPLTGLLNRAGLAAAHRRLLDEPAPRALLYVDLDHFKPINDRYGHAAGDQLLQMFATRLKDTVRSADVVARLGGDEFAILLSGAATIDSARVVVEKILRAASAPFQLQGRSIRLSASVGLAILQAKASLPELLSKADCLLYEAKEAGRGTHVARDFARVA